MSATAFGDFADYEEDPSKLRDEVTFGPWLSVPGPLTPYQCGICGEWWLRPAVSCCVIHSPGTCCHCGDVKPDKMDIAHASES